MAGELTLQFSITAQKPNTMSQVTRSLQPALDIAGTKYEQGLQSFTTSATALDIGEVTTVGFVYVRNTAIPGTGAGNIILSNGSGGAVVVQVRPGSAALFESATNTLFGKTSAGTLIGEFLIIEA